VPVELIVLVAVVIAAPVPRAATAMVPEVTGWPVGSAIDPPITPGGMLPPERERPPPPPQPLVTIGAMTARANIRLAMNAGPF
jgi:hypothetical protein